MDQSRRPPLQELAPLLPFVGERAWGYAAGLFWLLATNGFALLIPWLLKHAVDALRSSSPTSFSPRTYAAAMIAAALLHGGTRVLSRTTLLHGAREIEFSLREALFAKLLSLDPPFFSRERTGDLMSRFTNDLTNVRMLVGFGALNVLNTLILYGAALALMIRISPTLTIATLLPFPLMILVVKRLSASMFVRSRTVQERLADMTSFVEENVSGATVIKTLCREEDQIARFRAVSLSYLGASLDTARLRALMVPVMAATGGLGTMILLLYGGSLVIDGRITLGDFVAFSGYLAMLVWPTVVMGWILNLIQRGAASMQRINMIFDASPDIPPPPPVRPTTATTATTGAIRVESLSFSYGDTPVLRDVSFSLPAGGSLGITGAVGSGKSTLVKLLARLLPLQGGEIRYGDTPLSLIPEEELRRLVAVVPQESILFSRTIRENVLYGLEGGNEELLREVTERASLSDDVARFDRGFDTLVGERGVMLSGGQRQRCSIARAVAMETPVLILDDPLSAVDTRTEEAILSRLKDPSRSRTTIVVSHRLSPLAWCDRIILLDRGGIVEEGSHDELLARGGTYARLWELQRLERELEES